MPHSAPCPCRFAGCDALVVSGVLCEAHRRNANGYEVRRPNASARGYGAVWRRMRLMVLRRQPLCQWPGCNEIATQVDHIVPLVQGGPNKLSNLQALCASHHSMKTNQCDGGFGRVKKETQGTPYAQIAHNAQNSETGVGGLNSGADPPRPQAPPRGKLRRFRGGWGSP